MTTYAKDIMTTELILANPGMTIEDAIKMLVNNRITGMPVVDEARRIVGVVSEYDIIRAVDSFDTDKPLNLARAIDFTQKVATTSEDTPLSKVLRQFVEKKVRRLPVVNAKNELVGIITRRDIMRVLFYRSKTIT